MGANHGKMKAKANEEPNDINLTERDKDGLFEVLKRVDIKTLGKVACVNKNWNKAAMDDQLWEMLCRPYMWEHCNLEEFRSAVSDKGGFRAVYLHNIWYWINKGWEARLPNYALVLSATRYRKIRTVLQALKGNGKGKGKEKEEEEKKPKDDEEYLGERRVGWYPREFLEKQNVKDCYITNSHIKGASSLPSLCTPRPAVPLIDVRLLER